MFPALWKSPRRGGQAATRPFLSSFSPSTPSKNPARLLSLQKLSSHKSSSAWGGLPACASLPPLHLLPELCVVCHSPPVNSRGLLLPS